MAWREEFLIWVKELEDRFPKKHGKAVIEHHEDRLQVYIFTATHRYSIGAAENYLGCIASTRMPRAGEDWDRSNDLHDGPFGHLTWEGILQDILAYELEELAPPITNETTPVDASEALT